MSWTIIRAVLLVILLSISGSRADAETVLGAGASASCGTWLQARRNMGDQLGMAFGMWAWALGFVSGAATYGNIGDPLSKTDAEGVAYWLDSYCAAHPAGYFNAAVQAFIAERRP